MSGRQFSLIPLAALTALFSVALFWNGTGAQIRSGTGMTDADCAMCHGGEDADVPMATEEQINASVHEGVGCLDCHGDIQELPHRDDLDPANCASCHESEAEDYQWHGKGRVGEVTDLPGCADCHGSHGILSADDPASSMNRNRMSKTCGTCHSDINLVANYGLRNQKTINLYQESVHGNGTPDHEVTAACTDCHGAEGTAHRILGRLNAESRTHVKNIPFTCGACHEDVKDDYLEGIHGQLLMAGETHAPGCSDCHGEHGILSPSDPRSSVNPALLAEATCSPCHESARLNPVYGVPTGRKTSFIDSFHGLKSRAGDSSVANCASCHTAHKILPSSDPASSVNAANLQKTCGHCHAGIAAEFANTPIHTHDQVNTAWTDLVAKIYLILITSVIGGMLIFIGLDWARHIRELKRLPQVKRMDRNALFQHTLLMVSFIVLTVTGFALRYSEVWLFRVLFGWDGGSGFRGDVHRVAAGVFIFSTVWHAAYLFTRPGRRFASGMRPGIRDVREVTQATAHNLGLRSEGPNLGRFSFIEKAEYWALVWGTAVMIGTGFLIWFDGWALKMFSKPWLDVFRAVHLYEAWLAALAIAVWHFYGVIFRPGVYPGNPAWLTGNMPAVMYEEEHPGDPNPEPVPASRKT